MPDLIMQYSRILYLPGISKKIMVFSQYSTGNEHVYLYV